MKLPSFSRVILPILAGVGIIAAVVMISSGQPDRSPAAPIVSPPTTPQAQREGGTVAGSGVVEPSSEIISMAAPIAGVIEAVLVEPGAAVAAGDPLFRIDTRDARAAVAEAEARVEAARRAADAARAAMQVAQNQLALYQDVSDPRAISRLEMVDRKGSLANAGAQVALQRAQIATAVAELERARVDLARRTVRAPIAGEVLQVRMRAGEFAPAAAQAAGADALMTIGQIHPLHVRIDIDEEEAGRVAIGRDAVISARGDALRRVAARFVRAEPQVVPKRSLVNAPNERVDVRVLQVIFALPQEARGYFVGQQVDAFIPARAGQNK
jgi:HlyD family secretion protein